MSRNCERAGERDFLEGLVVELLASRGEPPPQVPHNMAGLLEALKARAAAVANRGGGGSGRTSLSHGHTTTTTTPANYELNRELGSFDQTQFQCHICLFSFNLMPAEVEGISPLGSLTLRPVRDIRNL